ncbi:uncharacterized protein [Macrobrachium rosenbergii]|uniref:uncharacterized protein n=1 Tax=Macrobrachium rosenbergii TaxID=79674 RepID=UPI0034D61431
MADVMMASLGADFLTAHNVLVDVADKQLIPRTAPTTSSSHKPSRHTTTKPSTSQPDQQICPIATDVPPPEMRELLQEYENVFREDLKHDLKKPAKHSIQHHIENLTYAKKVFKEMEETGICKKPLAHGHHPYTWYRSRTSMVPLQRLLTAKHRNKTRPIPTTKYSKHNEPGEWSKNLHKNRSAKRVFPGSGGNRKNREDRNQHPFGTYTFNYSCFGLRNSGATFQRLIDELFGDLPFCVVCVDDIIILRPNLKQHLRDVKKVLQRLKENRLSAGGQV